MHIRPASDADCRGILAIYNHAVRHTNAIWNDTPVDEENRRHWLREKAQAGFPVLAALEKDVVLGYAAYGAFRAFDGYRLTVEHAVYVAEGERRRGVGSALLGRLEGEARTQGMHVMLGAIAAENEASIRLHKGLGFVETARMPEVGRKFGRFLDLVFMQKVL
jgi:phosphinothricin acetyltransferase